MTTSQRATASGDEGVASTPEPLAAQGPGRARPMKQPPRPLTRRQVDSILSRSAGVVSLVFVLQTVPVLLSQQATSVIGWTLGAPLALLVTILISVTLAFTTQQAARYGQALVALTFLGVLISWPFFTQAPLPPLSGHWLYLLLTVATANASLAFGLRTATLYTLGVPILYGALRLVVPTPSPVDRVGLEVLYSLILGSAVLIISAMLRQAARAVDQAQTTALERYDQAVRHHAIEVERVQVDALVHDSVLTTFLSAARAYTPEAKLLAATMAGNAIGHLRDAARAPEDAPVEVAYARIAKRMRSAAADIGVPFALEATGLGEGVVPATAAETLISAATQAMVNSAQHAGVAVTRRIVLASDDDGLRIDVIDDGAGFAASDVPRERLGVRVSILERVASAGGSVRIDSAPGAGTAVHIRWPDAPQAAEPEPEEVSA